jgi:arsenite-transporting ATPase
VTNAEKMVVAESRRAYVALSLYGFPVDLVVANRLFGPEADDGYLAKWRKIQKTNMVQVNEFFAPLPIRTCRMFDTEMVGQSRLNQVADEIFNGDDPTSILHTERPFSLSVDNGNLTMKIRLPGVKKDEIDLWTKKDELIITVAGRRRNLLLPRAAHGQKLTKASFENDVFTICFEAKK